MLSTSEEVAKLQIELEEMQPLLEQAQIETDESMEQIKKDTAIAEETKEVVQREEKEANIKLEETKTIADDAQFNSIQPGQEDVCKFMHLYN